MGAPTEILSRFPDVRFASEGVQPPSAFYVYPTDSLFIRTYNSLAGHRVQLVARYLTPDGELKASVDIFTPATDRSSETRFFPTREGYLLNLLVASEAGFPRVGNTYAQLGLARGTGPAAVAIIVLASGYVISGQGLSWPGTPIRPSVEGPGLLRSITGTDPAAGAEISETVPTNARWRLRMLRVELVTAAAGGARAPQLALDDGATQFMVAEAVATQAGGLTRQYNAAALAVAPGATGSQILIPIPDQVMLFQGWRITTATVNLAAGDNYGPPQLLVEEWIED